jgi:hypothetical protein
MVAMGATVPDCCALEVNGTVPQHRITTAGMNFQKYILIWPLAFSIDLLKQFINILIGMRKKLTGTNGME